MKALEQYLDYCMKQKKLNSKTLKAYGIDLKQFEVFLCQKGYDMNKQNISEYIEYLHAVFKPRSAKRKIASLRAYFNYLEYENIISVNPFDKIRAKFREPSVLPKTLPLSTIQAILTAAYQTYRNSSNTAFQEASHIRDIAILEMLFATGLRVSELCYLRPSDIDLQEGTVKINGKGSKQRILQIGNPEVIKIEREYYIRYKSSIERSGFFFLNKRKQRISEQSVRNIINKCVNAAKLNTHVTPHMFRHSFATLLLEEDVDIRYIQRMLGHSSIVTTQIYTHVALHKQKDILIAKHPRNKISI